MIVRNDECVAWDVTDVLGFYPDDDESVHDMLVRKSKFAAGAPERALSNVEFSVDEYVVDLSWLTKE